MFKLGKRPQPPLMPNGNKKFKFGPIQWNLMMIGKTGHGKSSTGNSILGRTAFVVSDSSESETDAVQVAFTSLSADRGSVKVADTPGIGDTRMDTVTAIRKACKDLESGIQKCPGGVHAFLLVLKYGNRFTEEESRTVRSLKSLLGEDVLRRHCVIVFTHGELFDLSRKKGPGNSGDFSSWCCEQTGGLGDLIEECQHRCVLFYNLTTEKMKEPMTTLYSMLRDMCSTNGVYSHGTFEAKSKSRGQLITRANAPELNRKTDGVVSELRSEVMSVDTSSSDFDKQLSKISGLEAKVRRAMSALIDDDNGTGILGDQKTALNSLTSTLSDDRKTVTSKKAGDTARREAQAVARKQEEMEAMARRHRRRKKKNCVLQ